MRILIAEDDRASRAVLAGVLKKVGHEVVETANGAEAWRVMQLPDAPSLAIIDWMMPEMEGVEVVRQIRTLPTDQPPYLIMLTSKNDRGDIVVGLAAGANDYLKKPFDPPELRARIMVGWRMLALQQALAAKAAELQQALDQVKTLRGIIPICVHCKKVRDDQGYWNQVEVYVRDHSEANFSHGICPQCMAELHPEVGHLPSQPSIPAPSPQ